MPRMDREASRETPDLRGLAARQMGVGRRSLVILTGNHLCHNPRVIKVGSSLASWGWDVEVLGGWTSAELKRRDKQLVQCMPFRFSPVFDLAGHGAAELVRRLLFRIERRVAAQLFSMGRSPTRALLGYGARALEKAAQKRTAELYVAHSEPALWAANRLRIGGRRTGVDMEDWFSEDLLPEGRRNRPTTLLRELESALLEHGVFSSCPSRAMSDALAGEFNCRPPAAILNAFPWSDRAGLDGRRLDRAESGLTSIHWYSQTLGPGRGLESLMAALPKLIRPVDVYLRGVPAEGFDSWLPSLVQPGWKGRIVVLGLVDNADLLSRIAEHDIGLAAEMKYCRSRDLTITNKILHYLLAGLAVVASDTAGQREVASKAPAAVHLYHSGDSDSLAARLNDLLASPELLLLSKQAALQSARETFSWEHQEPVLRERVLQSVTPAPALEREASRTSAGGRAS